MRILLVDDEPEITASVADNLSYTKWSFLHAQSGQEALTLLQEWDDITVLATDFDMPPGMNGVQLVKFALALRPDLYTVVFTGWSDRGIRVSSLRAGVNDFIDKKGDIDDELYQSINMGLEQLALTRLGDKLAHARDEKEILNDVFQQFSMFDRFHGIFLATRGLGSNDYKVERAIDLETKKEFPQQPLKDQDSAYRFVVDQRKPYFPPIFGNEEQGLKPFQEEAKSVVIVPVTFRSHQPGALGIEHTKKDAFDLNDLRFLRQVGDHMSSAMEKLTIQDSRQLQKTIRAGERSFLARLLLHELKTPLNNLATAVDFAMEAINSDELSNLGKNIDKINRIADDFLPSLITHSQDEEVDLQHSVREAMARVRADEDVEIPAFEFSASRSQVPPIQGNRELLLAAFLGILHNSVKATGSNGRIQVKTAYVQIRDQIEIEISDNGPGIAPMNLARIFDYGFTTKKNNLGFGLPLTQDIVQQHGGTITVESTEGQGTTFKLTFPVSNAEQIPASALSRNDSFKQRSVGGE